MERGWWLVAVALLVLLALTGGVPGDQSGSGEGEVEVRGLYNLSNGTQLWPYTSTAHDVETRTLPINVYVNQSPTQTRDILTGDEQWEETDSKPAEDTESYSIARWGAASGADRYAAVYADGSGSVWLGEEFQLGDGHYLGAREHIRIYGRFDGSWSAIQAHGEYWDWFRLRHTVIDLDRARDGVVRDLEARGSDVTVIERDRPPHRVVLVAAALAVVAGRRRLSRRHLAAFGPGALYLGVRTTGIALESALPFVPPKAIAGVLYPFFLVGIPAVAYYWTRWADVDPAPVTAFALTVLGFAVALIVDGIAMGITDPSLRFLGLRTVAVGGLGVLATAGTTDRLDAEAGAFLWFAAIVVPLAGLV